MEGLLILAAIVVGIVFVIVAACGGLSFESPAEQPEPETNHSQPTEPEKTKENNNVNAWPFYPTYAMSRAEQAVYWRLVSALPDYIILAQVQASRVLKLRRGQNVQYWFNRINRMSYDFVVCYKNSYPLAVIELDDASHELPERQEADQRKNKALADAGLTLIRWKTHSVPQISEIKEIFLHLDQEQQIKRRQFGKKSDSII